MLKGATILSYLVPESSSKGCDTHFPLRSHSRCRKGEAQLAEEWHLACKTLHQSSAKIIKGQQPDRDLPGKRAIKMVFVITNDTALLNFIH